MEVRETPEFGKRLARLRDLAEQARIRLRLRRVEHGNLGDVRFIRHGVSEMRIDCGPGYRLYFTRRGERVVLLRVGGDKATQSRDIERPVAMAHAMEND